MRLLAEHRDSLIARKHGSATADQFKRSAADRLEEWNRTEPETSRLEVGPPFVFDRDETGRLDDEMTRRGRYNPGTIADLIVGALFWDRLSAD
jgi:triphosphoribosyl-dephospho-CoA synthetase